MHLFIFSSYSVLLVLLKNCTLDLKMYRFHLFLPGFILYYDLNASNIGIVQVGYIS